MRVVEARTRHFRNLQGQRLGWDSRMNLLIGANGSGKTNLLEAFHCLTGWGPFDGRPWGEVRAWGQEAVDLVASFAGESSATVQITLTARPSPRLDGRRTTWTDLRLAVPSLAFLPSHLALVEGGPSVRRRFLDVIGALVFPLYARRLSDWRRLTRSKRRLLRSGRSTETVDRTMEPLAGWLWEGRRIVVAGLSAELTRVTDLCPEVLRLGLIRGGAPNGDFRSSLACQALTERTSGLPLVGPHRDELTLVLGRDGRPAAMALSRGQRRRAALALVLAAGGFVQSRLHRAPILLIDEVASELDAQGRQLAVAALDRSGFQIFAATAENGGLDWPGACYRMDAGSIRQS